jgi:hypothetical protein
MSDNRQQAIEKYEREVFIEKLHGEFLDVFEGGYDAGYANGRRATKEELLNDIIDEIGSKMRLETGEWLTSGRVLDLLEEMK